MKTPSVCFLLFTAGALSCASMASAREGMWTPDQLVELGPDLAKTGSRLDPKGLADLTTGPLAAVINFNGCSASFVSKDGLFITNHHCAVRAIQRNSTGKKSLLEDGFTAADRKGELSAGPASRVQVTLSQRDVTSRFADAVAHAKGDKATFDAVDHLKKQLVAACEKDPRVRCQVAVFDGGARYVLVARLNIKDVRLVHAPPRAIGVFGGDTDNWMWPRHTGDWSIFRAYVGPDGDPADYSLQNQPFHPKRWLTTNPAGVSPGDVVMVAGFPYRTSRHKTASELRYAGEVAYPRTVRRLQKMVDLLAAAQKTDAEARVRLTSKRAGLANYLKYAHGLLDGFHRSGAVAHSASEAAAMRQWINNDRVRKARYGQAFSALEARLAKHRRDSAQADLLRWIFRVPTATSTAGRIHWLAVERAKPDADREAGYQTRDEARIKSHVEAAFRAWHPASDAALLTYLLNEAASLPKGQHIAALDAWIADHGGIQEAVRWLYAGVTLTDATIRAGLLGADRATVERSKDRALAFAAELYPTRRALADDAEAFEGAMARLRPIWMAAKRQYSTGLVYSDANATLRVTYGQVEGYSPREAVQYSPQTTLRGILEKDTGEEPFDVPAAERQAILDLQKHPRTPRPAWFVGDTVPVNFLSGCDTTGGNSGSPTLDRDGRLVGLLFDGNYEAMASDWVFDPIKTRSIHVDIRYVIWALDALFDADWILEEMGIKGI